MTPGEIRACYQLYAAHRKSHEICALPRAIPATSNTEDSDDLAAFCCACTPALKGWRVTSATAIQTTTYARPSPGLSVICKRCSHRSPNCSVAALWWSAETVAAALQ
jgi:hypothetical protein